MNEKWKVGSRKLELMLKKRLWVWFLLYASGDQGQIILTVRRTRQRRAGGPSTSHPIVNSMGLHS